MSLNSCVKLKCITAVVVEADLTCDMLTGHIRSSQGAIDVRAAGQSSSVLITRNNEVTNQYPQSLVK